MAEEEELGGKQGREVAVVLLPSGMRMEPSLSCQKNS
jgi:hypothetical protein